MEKERLKKYLIDGLSYRKIAKLEGFSAKKVEYWVNKHNVKFLSKFNKDYQKSVDHGFFDKIDTKEKAYIVGFILGDGHIDKKNGVNLRLALSDKQVIQDISDYIPWETKISVDMTFDKKSKRFPNASMNFRSVGFGKNLVKFFGNRLKKGRHTPIVPKHYQKYLLAGFFDADGCVTYGYRKDRGRLWHKISFTADLSILIGIQKILLRYDIASSIKPKTGENTSIIEFANKPSIKKFSEMLPIDGIRLGRKVTKLRELVDKL